MISILTKYVLPVVAAVMLILAVGYVVRSNQSSPPVQPPVRPPVAPFEHAIAGAGVVESKTENIEVGSPTAGIVVAVFAEEGAAVASGETLLFRLDDRQLQAELNVRQAAEESAAAAVDAQEAQVHQSSVALEEREDKFRRVEPLRRSGTISEEAYP